MTEGARKRVREKLVAMAPFLRACPQVTTLGIRSSLVDYTPQQRRMLLSARLVLFPTQRFVRVLQAAGRKTFPSSFAYSIQKSRLMQEVLFQLLKCPHPLTHLYYGRQKNSILEDFAFPFWALGPKKTDNAWLVSNERDLKEISGIYNPLIIQEMLHYSERFRLLFVNYECCGVLGRVCGEELRSFDSCEIPSKTYLDRAVAPASFSGEIISDLERLLRSVQINDIVAEIGITRGCWRLIELLRPPVYWQTHTGLVNRFNLISSMIESNLL